MLKTVYIRSHIDSARWKFFAYTRPGKALTTATTRMWERHPNRVTERLMLFCLPF